MLVASSENSGLNPMTFKDSTNDLLYERLRYQRQNGRFTDVEIVVDNRLFAAHRNILAAHSPYFDAIFKHCKVTKEQLTVNSRQPAAFERFLDYMYSGTVIIDRTSVAELLKFANNFLIFKLKNYCTEYLDRYLDAANCLSIRTLAQTYNLPTLIKASNDYFDSNLNRCLLESTDIIEFTFTQLTRLVQEEKYVDVITADTYLKLIVRWIGEKIKDRDKMFRLLLSTCDFPTVTADTLEFLLDYSPLLAKSQKSRFLLLHVMEENNMLMEKYSMQLETLRQQIKTLPELFDASHFEDEIYATDDSEDEDFVDGQPSGAQVIQGDDDRIKMKISFAAGQAKRKRPRTLRTKPIGQPEPRNNAVENESIPWIDEDGIDGVFATTSLDGAHTYGPPDRLDPDDVDDEDEIQDENGKYTCMFCGFRTAEEEELDKHQARTHNRNTFYQCHLCEFETNWTKQYYQHCSEHWKELPYACKKCPFNTNSMQEYLKHRLHHTQDRYFKCGECAWKGRTRSQLFAHERMHSVLDDRPLHCEECGRGFLQHAALDEHIRSHDDPRPIRCDDCGFMTKSLDHLTLHRRQHTGDNFKCHISGCDYSSTKKSQLAAHLRTHMAVRAHMCKICGRGFIEKSHLVRHERIHLEDKPFKCEQCEYASSRRDKLKEHIIKHHNEMNPTSQKMHRRKHKRQRMLAAANNMVNNPDVLFRPITTDDAVSNWQRNNDFSAYSPHNDYGAPGPSTYQSPPRAYSEVQQPQQQHHAPPPQSPGCMSMMNVPLGDNLHQMIGDSRLGDHGGGRNVNQHNMNQMNVNSHDQLMTPTFNHSLHRTQDNRSAIQNPFNLPNSDLSQRPTSLPTYGQMDMVQGLQVQGQQLQQMQQDPNQQGNSQQQQWNHWNL